MKQHPSKENNGKGTGVRAPFWLMRLAVVAVTVTVLWVAGNFVFYNNKSGESIYYAYYQPYTNVFKSMGQLSGLDYTLAMGQYENGDYREALVALEKAIVGDADNFGLQFYHAICQLELRNTDFAIADFEYITNANDPTFSTPSKWYLGLAYLKLNQKGKACKVFRSITESDGPYRKKAAEILAML